MDEELDSLAQQYALKRNIKVGERLVLAFMVLSSLCKTTQNQDLSQ